MKKKAIIFGSGSISSRHVRLLRKLKISKILIFSKRSNNKLNFTSKISDLVNFKPDYILVCSETFKHYQHLKIIDKKFRKKHVLVEKPLFDKPIKINLKNNSYFVGYNLRFHPVIKFLKKKIKKNDIFSVSVICNSFLPNWRKNIDYFKSYSSSKTRGGGVLLDLSHEIDYLQWLIGDIDKIEYKKIKKISNLKISSEDNAQVIGKIKHINFKLNLTYFSRYQERRIIIDGKNETIVGDLINYNVSIFSNNSFKKINFKKSKDKTYIDQHLAILKKQTKNVCNLNSAQKTLKFIKELK